MRVDLSFPHEYEVEVLDELPGAPGGPKQLYFPGSTKSGGRDGILVKVSPGEGPSWIGTFASGGLRNGLTAIFSCPDRRSVCVVAAGNGYMVRADNPSLWKKLPSIPVLDARSIPDRHVLVFADFTKLVAYAPQGLVWITESLSWDGITITEVTPDSITGMAWDAPTQRQVAFSVNLTTGKHEGGSSPEAAATLT